MPQQAGPPKKNQPQPRRNQNIEVLLLATAPICADEIFGTGSLVTGREQRVSTAFQPGASRVRSVRVPGH
jgi:hypothetical protein